ncbi:hypothetical protein QAD02_001233 [Eretmocerus hayati]|uniref:Uncharacterized protein n=1 Tax=Eretmocerus hayati TaxID=131215 RepID=A0ACC2NFV9_9HYME|nr:hypothetical protein QAD02_001233 [Eretmocerus hayati]
MHVSEINIANFFNSSRPNDRVIRSPSPSSEDDISLRLSEVGSSINCQQNENNIVRGSPTNQSSTSTTEIPLCIPQTSSPPPTINPLQANPSVPLPLPNDVISLSNSAPFLGQAQDSEKQCCTSSMSTLENFNQERIDEVNEIKPENDLKVGPEPEIRVVLEYVHDVDQDLLRTRFRIKFYIDDENTTTDRSEILMFEIGLSGPNMYENLCHELLNSFPNLVGKKFIIYYRGI